MREMLLFGAGASKEAGVPLAFELTRCISDAFRKENKLSKYAHAVSFVLGGLLFNKGIRGDDPLSTNVNVEEFFNAVMMLADRSTLDAAPFIGTWHGMIDQLDRIKPPARDVDRLLQIIHQNFAENLFKTLPRTLSGFSSSDIERRLADFVSSIASNRHGHFNAIGGEIGKFVLSVINQHILAFRDSSRTDYRFAEEFRNAIDRETRPGGGKVFHAVARAMIKMLARFVLVDDPASVAYLEPLSDLLRVQNRLTIASLNYDNCVELFCEHKGIPCLTGIDEWSKRGTFEFEGDGIFLLKLHGSIDWRSGESEPSLERPLPHRVIKRVSVAEAKTSNHEPAIIFGQRNKLTAEGPFLELIRSFQRELSEVDRLTAVGYSFADPHINVFISQWLNADRNRELRIIDPRFDADRNEYTKELEKFAKKRKTLIPQGAGEGLRTLFGNNPPIPATVPA